jgi:hypothetical protein
MRARMTNSTLNSFVCNFFTMECIHTQDKSPNTPDFVLFQTDSAAAPTNDLIYK